MLLSDKTRELIAIGASITATCQPCRQFHADKALQLGADSEEVASAIEIGSQVRQGSAAKMDAFSSRRVDSSTSGQVGKICCG